MTAYEYGNVKELVDCIDCGIQVKKEDPHFINKKFLQSKLDEVVPFVRSKTTSVSRNVTDDREYQLDAVSIQKYRNEHDDAIETAIIHTGPYANEFARSLNALAVTVADDIYFRDGAFRPESEEGRQLLTHELTHVMQYQKKEVALQEENRKELEEEAEYEERKERREDNPFQYVRSRNKIYKLRKSDIPEIIEKTARGIKRWLEGQGNVLGGEDYLKLLCDYQRWLNEA
jgi:hypothetical protein